MMPYASRTGTKRNLAVLREKGWRLLVSAKGRHRTEGFRYGIDNGAWTAFQKSEPFDTGAFESVVEKLGAGADWIVVPDIVEGGTDSLRFSESWLPRLESFQQLLIAVQDGMTPDDVSPLLGGRVGIFLGGSTEWKLSSMRSWGDLAHRRQCYFHVARVNSARRIRLCGDVGAHSFDGTSVSRYAKTIQRLDNEVKQQWLF